MVLIRTQGGAGGVKYQVIVRNTNEPDTTRSFRKLSEAKAHASGMSDVDLNTAPATTLMLELQGLIASSDERMRTPSSVTVQGSSPQGTYPGA